MVLIQTILYRCTVRLSEAYDLMDLSVRISCFSDLQSELEKRGKIRRISDSKAKWFFSTPLKCNSCDAKPKNMPDLKKHLKTHVGLYQKWSVLPTFTSTD